MIRHESLQTPWVALIVSPKSILLFGWSISSKRMAFLEPVHPTLQRLKILRWRKHSIRPRARRRLMDFLPPHRLSNNQLRQIRRLKHQKALVDSEIHIRRSGEPIRKATILMRAISQAPIFLRHSLRIYVVPLLPTSRQYQAAVLAPASNHRLLVCRPWLLQTLGPEGKHSPPSPLQHLLPPPNHHYPRAKLSSNQ